MSAVDAILARSRRPGRFVEHRRFTLSREQAIARHRGSTLRHPAWYVLELVQAAVFAGADYLAVETRPGSLRLAWVGGRPITPREVERLFDHLFVDRADPDRRHLVHLATGLNALLRRSPRRVRLETGDGRRAVRMDLDRRGAVRVGQVDEPVEGTCLVVHFREAWLRRLGGETWCEEQGLVEQRCQYAPVPILLDGAAPFGYRGDAPIEIFGALHQRAFSRDGRRGVVALPERGQLHAGFRIVIGGVWVSTLPLRGLATRPLIGVVCDDRLRRSADGSSVVRDARFHELVAVLREEATALLTQVEGPGYTPPPLRVPEAAPELPSTTVVPAVPLPRRFRALTPRGPLSAAGLLGRSEPLFWCAPEDVARLVEPTDPARFPQPVVVLRDAERRALERNAPRLALWQLRDTTDVDFAIRHVQRRERIRERVVDHEGGRLRVRVHLDGPVPSWGEGVPFAVVREGRTVLLGGIQGDRVVPTGARGTRRAPWGLGTPLWLPRTSLVLEGPLSPDDALLQRARAETAALLHGLDDPLPADLLAALLGAFVPRFADEVGRVEVEPPPGAPGGLVERPLLSAAGGSLSDLLAALGTEAVLPVDTIERLAALAPIERRFGWGHLGHPSLDGRPVWAVGRIGGRWLWLERPELLRAPALECVVQVGANLAPPRRDGWIQVARPHPAVTALRRADVPSADPARGLELLTLRLRRAALDDGWPLPLTPVDPERARALGRLALLALAARDRPTDLLLRPTDGASHRSLADLGADPAVRAVARGGVHTREPTVFALTLDERVAIAPAASLRSLDLGAFGLDGPDDAGWLTRVDLVGPGVGGVLGLEHPYAGGGSVIVRAATGPCALRGLDLPPGRHGLLDPRVPRAPRPSDLRLLALEMGVRLSSALLTLLDGERLDPARAESARLHALATALVAWRRGHLAGVAWELARRASVRDARGGHWGTLADWLATPPGERPALPEAVARLAGPDGPAPDLAAPVHARVAEIVAEAGLKVRLSWVHQGRGPPVRVSEERSSPTRVVLLLDRAHPAVARAAVEPGPARELVLLECARRLAAWARTRGVDLDLSTMQRLLLARRLQEPLAPTATPRLDSPCPAPSSRVRPAREER